MNEEKDGGYVKYEDYAEVMRCFEIIAEQEFSSSAQSLIDMIHRDDERCRTAPGCINSGDMNG